MWWAKFFFHCFVDLACLLPILVGFHWHFQASVHCFSGKLRVKRKILVNAENQTWGCWVRSKYATSELYIPLLFPSWFLCFVIGTTNLRTQNSQQPSQVPFYHKNKHHWPHIMSPLSSTRRFNSSYLGSKTPIGYFLFICFRSVTSSIRSNWSTRADFCAGTRLPEIRETLVPVSTLRWECCG